MIVSRLEADRRYCWLYPIMWLLACWAAVKKRFHKFVGLSSPEVNSIFFDGLGVVCRSIKEGAASWRALNLIYNYSFPKPRKFSDRIDNLWLMSPNAQGVRNRHKLATEQISEAVELLSGIYKGEKIRILSLAAGSAEGLLNAVAETHRKGIGVSCLLVDHNELAMEYATRVAESLDIKHLVKVEVTSVTSIPKIKWLMAQFSPHIVEMMGLLDYIEDAKAVSLVRTIRFGLPAHGRFFTCNIMPNPEQHFLKHVLNWDMIYRTPEELKRLFVRSGFEDIRILTEPMNIHSIAIGERPEVPQELHVGQSFAKTAGVVQ
jgi:extracellular factor (EF) 3-hydroxypalmitic acid methyl ester biosynthesis protein